MTKKTLIYSSTFAFCLFLLLFTYVNFIKRTKGFCMKKIISFHEYSPKWDVGPLTPEQCKLIKQINGETFTYLGSGKQCYAFVNKERDLVLKFFKQKHMKTQSILNHIPFPLPPYLKSVHDETTQRRTHLRNKTFFSYLIAYRQFAARTGVLYLHLNHTDSLNCKIELVSRRGTHHLIVLDNMEFLIQRHADKVFNYFDKLLKEDKIKESKQAIGSILDLIITRGKSGISDRDNNCERNIGFIHDRAALIDLGEFRLIPPSSPSAKELKLATADLRSWIQSRNPELATFIDIQIQKRVSN